ncbi:MAG: GNAT family N-acetyltransferase [Lentisphaeria bacterium]|nr:GNAT family N-acetyltransferase [Lentisphaeria bacterium]
MDFEFVYIGNDPVMQPAVIPVLARCFEEWQGAWERGGKFPFLELSFIAREPELHHIIGHVGIMPFRISDGRGGIWKAAGIASVATLPEYRGKKIAARLCTMAAEWAAQEGYDFLPLYTAFFRVYECCGWNCFHDAVLRLKKAENADGSGWRKGSELSAEERETIRMFYETSFDFPGKVLRADSGDFHSWERMFREGFLLWKCTENGYAVRQENTLAELCVRPGHAAEFAVGCTDTFLPSSHPAAAELLENGFRAYGADEPVPDIRHGECMMASPLEAVPGDFFFPLTDKF